MNEQELKATRVTIDGLFKAINNLPKSREVSLAYTTCQLSKMWLGKALNELGAAYPYKESKDPTTGNYIAPTADEGKGFKYEGTVIEQIKWMRFYIDDIVKVIKDDFNTSTDEVNSYRFEAQQSYKYIVECGMWLGMELGRIRDNEGK